MKIRKITRFELALEQYEDYCAEHYQYKNGTKKKEIINEEYSYLNKKQGYWYLRDKYGWLVAFVDRFKGKVFIA